MHHPVTNGYKPPPPMPARSAPKTGGTYDMADLVTYGTATKVPRQALDPVGSGKMAVLGLSEMTLPGDLLPQQNAEPIYDRMAKIIRSRSLDLLNLMDDFLKRPAFSKMPTRNRAFLDIPTFRRALCYAFGDQWMRLGMTSAEFQGIWEAYVTREASNPTKGEAATVGAGMPESLILWQSFAKDVQRFTDGEQGNPAEIALRQMEQELVDKSAAAAREAEAARDADDNFADAKNTLKKRQAKRAEEDAKPIGSRGATVGQLNACKKQVCATLMVKHATVRAALKDIDDNGNGILSREEVIALLHEYHVIKYTDFYTGEIRGMIDMHVIETLLDLVDANGDGQIKYDEFANVVMADVN